MLTPSQETYLEKVSDNEKVDVKPWDSKAAEFAEGLVSELQAAVPEADVLWSGALALHVAGVNDVDVSIIVNTKDFAEILPKLVGVFGEPQIKGEEKILWRTHKDGYKVDAYLGTKDSEDIQMHKKLFELLRDNKELREEYQLLKESSIGVSLREYQRRKLEFYNRISGTGLQ